MQTLIKNIMSVMFNEYLGMQQNYLRTTIYAKTQIKINMNTAVIDPAITPGCCPLFLVPTDIHVHGHFYMKSMASC